MHAQVSADFTVDKTSGCAPLVVNFLDISNQGNSWLWDFGNGVTSTEQNPTFIFTQPGFYSITLITSENGISDTIVRSSLIRVNPSPIANFMVDEAKGCSPHTPNFTDISIPLSGTITDWFWSFGNGQTSTEQNPAALYIDQKGYDVFLRVTDANGCESTVTKSNFITLDGPEAKFVFDSVVCGLPANVTFLNQSQGNDLTYLWDFGDGSTATGDIPGTHTYSAFDSSQVTLIVTERNTGCTDTAVSSIVVGNYEASFDWNIICGDDEFTIEVENTTSLFTSLEWDFGGQATKFTQTANHNFSSRGPFEVTLRATVDPSCWDTTTISYNLPIPNLSYEAPICSDPFEVTFTNLSSGTGLSYDWDFGDTTFSTEVNPVHIYDVPPERFNAQLRATDTFGCTDSIRRNVIVPFPIARFYEVDSIYTGCAPLDLTFKDTSYTLSSNISSVEWDFGDPESGLANFSTDTNPNHIFEKPGDYDITYIIFTDDGCSDTVIYPAFIKAGEKPTSASFTQLENDSICYGETITFIDTAEYATSYVESNYFCWAFEENQNALLADPESPPNDCPPLIQRSNLNNPYINFNNPRHRYNEFNHEPQLIGDTAYTGQIVPNAGNLYTHLIVGYNNCFVEVIEPTFVDTTIAVTGYVIEDSLELFSDTTTTFGFYQASLNYDSIAYSYVYTSSARDTLFYIPEQDTLYQELQEGQLYRVRTKVINSSSGCDNEITDLIRIDSIRMGFDMNNRQCFNDNPVQLIDTSHAKFGVLFGREWLINDVVRITDPLNRFSSDTFNYNFPDTGIYKVTLRNTYRIESTKYGKRRFGFTTKNFSKYIKIEGVKARGFSDTLKICGGETIQFTDTSKSTTLINYIEWKFGDESDSSNLQNPSHKYDFAGLYRPSIIVTDVFGCYDSIVLPTIEVNRPEIDFEVSDSLICKGDAIAISNRSAGASLSFTWTVDTFIQQNIDIIQRFDSVGKFDIKLYAVDLFGCEDSLIKPERVTVSDFPQSAFTASPRYIECPPLLVNFSDTSTTEAIKWKWLFNDTKSDGLQNSSFVYTSPGLYDVSLISTNIAGCSDTLTKEDYIEIDGPYGTITFDNDTMCLPDSVIFDLDFSKTEFYIFSYGNGTTQSYTYNSNPDSIIYNYQNGGAFRPSVSLIDQAGCFFTLPEQPLILADSIDARFTTLGDIICDVSNIPFTNTSRFSLNNVFQWNFDDGATSNQNAPVHSYLVDSTYNVSMLQTSAIGCTDSVSKTITVYNAPFADLEIVNDDFCVPSQSQVKIKYNNIRFKPDNIFFTINDEVQNTGDSINYNFNTAGNNKIGFTIQYGDGNCRVDSLVDTTFYDLPIANFSYSPKNVSLDNPLVFFTNTSQNSTISRWDFGNNQVSNAESPGHNYNNEGVYQITLISSNLGGCSDTTFQEIKIAPFDFIKLPNAFSPNGDGENEEFGIIKAGAFSLEVFKIFNRWGNVVFETNNIEEFWNGEKNGAPQNTGTYIYYIKGVKPDGENIEVKGNFILLR